MKAITSRDNPALKKARKLLTKKGRDEASAFLAEGEKLISEASGAGFAVERVFINAGALSRGEAASLGYPDEVAVDEKLFCELAQTKTPGPYIAVISGSFPGKAIGYNAVNRVLILDRIGDPGNTGTMIRTALAAGIDEVWCIKGTSDVFSEKAIRASAGAVFHLPVKEGITAEGCIKKVRDIGARLFVLEADGADLFNTQLTGKIAIAVGNEGRGPQQKLKEAADVLLGIPMAEVSESLNAATAAAVVMYEALRQSTVS